MPRTSWQWPCTFANGTPNRSTGDTIMDVRLPISLFAAALVMGQPTASQQQPPPPPPSRPQQTQPPPKPQQPPATSQATKAALPASDAQFLKKVNEDNLAEVE